MCLVCYLEESLGPKGKNNCQSTKRRDFQMKYFILGVSGLIMVVLIIASIFYYQHERQYSYLHQPTEISDDQVEAPNQVEQSNSHGLQATNPDERISYTLQNDELNITFNNGEDWTTVPVEVDQLFSGEYNGTKEELIEGSYILTENRAAFLYSDGENWDHQRILLTYSTDQGKTWEESVVTEPFTVMRFRKVDFLNENFGYIIISGGRTMSQESSHVFLTHNGGVAWEETTNSGVTRLIFDGGFVDESTGFLSFGTINPEEPTLYVTQNGGDTWNEVEEDHLSVLVNQGPNGDYKGGGVKGKFISIPIWIQVGIL